MCKGIIDAMTVAIPEPGSYRPYACATVSSVRRSPMEIASRFHFLDRAMAGYFSAVARRSPLPYLQRELDRAGRSIENYQRTEDMYLGELGQFRELVLANLRAKRGPPSFFQISVDDFSSSDDAVLKSMQEELDIPCWALIINLFIDSSINISSGRSMDAEIIFRILDSVKNSL